MLKTASLLALALSFTTPAFAGDTVSPGQRKLAEIAGVQPGVYSQAQLQQLIDAQRDGNRARVNFILNSAVPLHETISSRHVPTSGQQTLAQSAGVEVGRYSTAEMMQLIKARSTGNQSAVNLILSQ